MASPVISVKMLPHLIVALMLSVMLAVSSVGVANAKPNETLSWGTLVNVGECGETKKLVINVNQEVINSVDSGEGGNNWAFDDYRRQIQVWEQSDGDYCAVVRYEGIFDGQEGQRSPGNEGFLSGEEDGAFDGGYRAIIGGDLKDDPDWKTRGSVGTTDYDCNIAGICPGAENWVDKYFEPGYSFAYDWWGWIYHGGSCGTWVNSVDGNSGDILCEEA